MTAITLIIKYLCMFILCTNFFKLIYSHPENPCPNIFLYKFQENEWYGEIKLTIAHTEFGFANIGLNMSLSDSNSDTYVAELLPVGTSEEIYDNIENFKPLTFTISFAGLKKIPSINFISLNNDIICSKNQIDGRHTVLVTNTLSWSKSTNFVPNTNSITNTHTNTINKFNQPKNCGNIDQFSNNPHPWYVAIYEDLQSNYGILSFTFTCGGTLISPSHIVTAAHCIKNIETRLLIELGSREANNLILRYKKTVYKHPEFRPGSSHADIAIIELNENVLFNSNIQPICLWPEESTSLSTFEKIGTRLNWDIDGNGKLFNKPTQTSINIELNEKCEIYPYTSTIITDTSLCTSGTQNFGTCITNSGGILAMKFQGHWTLRGVLSEQENNNNNLQLCQEHIYSVYTDLIIFLGWIKRTVELYKNVF